MIATRMVALAALELDDAINARRHRTDEGIDELKASIHAHGLVQPLRVRTAEDGKYRIVAGSRRHRALCELATDGDTSGGVTVNADFLVPVLVGEEDDTIARELSQAENFIRLPQHEADTYETFRELADRGLDEAQIAARFGIEPKVVKRMLALGRLSPMILDAWRAGVFDERGRGFETVRAFTLAPSIEEQERVFTKLTKDRNLHAHAVMVAFGAANREVAEMVKIAGLEAYKAAGGRMTQDLFGDNHVIMDVAIAEQVAEQKIEATLAGLKAEGWSWVSLASALPYSWEYSWRKETPGDGKATAEEKKQIKKLEKAAIKGTEGAAGELAALQRAIADRQWTPDQLAAAGAVLEVRYHGDLKIVRGVVKPQAEKKAATADGTKEKAAPAISNAMTHRLSIQATKATQAALAQEPRLGLVALLAGIMSWNDGPVKASVNGIGRGGREPERYDAVFARCAAMSDAELFKVAAGLAGEAIDLQRHNSGNVIFDRLTSPLATAIDAERMTAALIETFDAADYFGGVSKPIAIQAIREAINDDEARKADKLKKKELVEFALANVPKTGWLPPELRCATYTGPGEVPAVSPAPTVEPDDDPDFDEIEGEEEEFEAAAE